MNDEARFYEAYAWCLDPILRLRDQLRHFSAELRGQTVWPRSWEEEERIINLYLLACGIACTVDDYLARLPRDLSLVAERFPRLRVGVSVARWLINLPHMIATLAGDRGVRRWRRTWSALVDDICALLIARTREADAAGRSAAIRSWEHLHASPALPPRVLDRRLRLPEAFRRQDLTHHDVLTLVSRFAAAAPEWARDPLLVVGVRTAGAYFAPLAVAFLAARGWSRVGWLTVRPKNGVSPAERRTLRELARHGGRVLIVDDHPNTGRTLALTVGALRHLGVPPDHIAVLVPGHPALGPFPPSGRDAWAAGVRLITLVPAETHKTRLLEPRAMQELLREYFRPRGWRDIALHRSAELDARNAQLADHGRDSFQVRLKRAYEVRLRSATGGREITQRVVAKSVGWGWLGYHAYLIGTRLSGTVPPVVGLRNGILLTEWMEAMPVARAAPAPRVLGAYVARRAQRLRLAEDPHLEPSDSAWTGWDQMARLLRGFYGPYVGRAKAHALRTGLGRYATPLPTAIDGRMRPEDWLATRDGWCKVDFEHHSFGTPDLDVVDPAYDLAAATFEFGLDEAAEHEMLAHYARASGDAAIADRLIWYKLLYGAVVLQQASGEAARAPNPPVRRTWNTRLVGARTFLTVHLHRQCAALIPNRDPARWSPRLFFLDLDGVFDSQRLPFPHTTAHGLEAVRLLRDAGFGIVLNSGRSVAHIRQYCQAYGFPGGIAEYGSVFVDAVRGRELPLIDADAAVQLRACRTAASTLPGVSTDPEYEHIVRAYRHAAHGSVPLEPRELQALLGDPQFDRLAWTGTSADSYIVQRGVDKGTGMAAALQYLGRAEEPVVAIGDGTHDVPALQRAAHAYAPANCTADVRALARAGHCRVMRKPAQRGLLAAVRDLLGAAAHHAEPTVAATATLLWRLLAAPDRSWVEQVLAAVDWRVL